VKDPKAFFPDDPLSVVHNKLSLESVPNGTVLVTTISLLRDLGFSQKNARTQAENIALAFANFMAKQETQLENSLIELSREVGFRISSDLPLESIVTENDSSRTCSKCLHPVVRPYRIFNTDGMAARTIIKDIADNLTIKSSLAEGTCCTGTHSDQYKRDGHFLDAYVAPAFALHLGKRGVPVCYACFAGCPSHNEETEQLPSVLGEIDVQNVAGLPSHRKTDSTKNLNNRAYHDTGNVITVSSFYTLLSLLLRAPNQIILLALPLGEKPLSPSTPSDSPSNLFHHH
jgi:hypothetical protein